MLSYKAGNRASPTDNVGEETITIEDDGSVTYTRVHGEVRITHGVRISDDALGQLRADLQASGFPAVPPHRIPPGASLIVIRQGEQQAFLDFYQGKTFPGYREVIQRLDACAQWLRAAHSSNHPSEPPPGFSVDLECILPILTEWAKTPRGRWIRDLPLPPLGARAQDVLGELTATLEQYRSASIQLLEVAMPFAERTTAAEGVRTKIKKRAASLGPVVLDLEHALEALQGMLKDVREVESGHTTASSALDATLNKRAEISRGVDNAQFALGEIGSLERSAHDAEMACATLKVTVDHRTERANRTWATVERLIAAVREAAGP